MPDWNYDIEPSRAILTHGASGERIELDTLNGPGVVSDEELAEILRAHRRPGPATRRLRQLYPVDRMLRLGFDELAEEGLLYPVDEQCYDLCHVVWKHGRALASFLKAWEHRPGDRPWLASRVGDWPAAHEIAREADGLGLIEATGRQAQACRLLDRERLRARAADDNLSAELLLALVEADRARRREYLGAALGEAGDAAPVAMELIAEEPGYVEPVARLLRRSYKPGMGISYLRGPLLAYLERHGGRGAVDPPDRGMEEGPTE